MFELGGRQIGNGAPPFIIAELSANHGGSIQRAKDTMVAAVAAGADAVKMQTYTPDTMTLESDKPDFQINDGLWKGYNLYDLYKEAYTPFEWHESLFEFAKQNSILLFSTPFDETAVDLLESVDTPAYKIASFELTDLPLIAYAASKGKPIFMSTGMASIDEVAEAVETCFDAGNKDLLLFHCISSYPAELENSHLGDIKYLSDYFEVEVGLSDHTTTNTASVLAVSLGASAIEKHFKVDEEDCGPDSSFSILPSDLSALRKDCDQAHSAVASDSFERSGPEVENKRFRRSLYFVRDCYKGDVISEGDIRRVRPGYGLPPKYNSAVLGKTLTADVERGDPVTADVIAAFEAID